MVSKAATTTADTASEFRRLGQRRVGVLNVAKLQSVTRL
jgi:hypothetical protein